MLYTYNIDTKCRYIPIHLNTVFSPDNFSFTKDYLDEKIVLDICEIVVNTGEEFYILDLSRINMSDSRVFTKFNEIFAIPNKYLIFINLNNLINSFIYADCVGYVVPFDSNLLVSDKVCIDYITGPLENRIQGKIKEAKQAIITNYLYEHAVNTDQFLDSSNVYANKYVDIKTVFLDPEVNCLVLYEMCCLFFDNFLEKNISALVSASNNGAAIASIIGQLIDKKVLYLQNLGPHLTIRDKKLIDKVEAGNKYLFVYDFICLGTELKLAKTVVNLKSASIVGAIGVAHFKKPDDSVLSLVDVSQVPDFDYRVFVK